MTPEERKALLKKFDKDGDGKLNEKERRAMREHIRAQRGNGDKPGAKPGDKPGAKPGDKPGAKPGDKPGAKPGNKPPVRGEGGRRRPGADKKNPGDRKDGKGQIGSDNV
jgi:hypothetical protein